MPRMHSPPITTAEQLLQLHEPGCRHELVRGQLRRTTPAGQWHGGVAMRLGSLLETHVRQHRLGLVFAAETGFLLARDPDTVLAPDIAFVRSDRLADVTGDGYFPGPPDLAVEVLSPGDTRPAVRSKVRSWLAHGTLRFWVVDPKARTVTVHRDDADTVRLCAGHRLDANGIVPGFAVPVLELFQAP